MFYEKFVELCVQRGIAPTKAAVEAGLTSGSVTGWKKGAPPRSSAIQKIANYFGVPVEYFNGDPIAGTKNSPANTTGELSDTQQAAWDMLQQMDEKTLEKFIKMAKLMLGE